MRSQARASRPLAGQAAGELASGIRNQALAAWMDRAQESPSGALVSRAEALVRELSRSLGAQALAALAEAWAAEAEEAGLTPFVTLGLLLEMASALRDANLSELARQAGEFVLLTAQVRADRSDERWQAALAAELDAERKRGEEVTRKLAEQAKGRLEFLAAVSHELRTPLMAMAGGAEFLTEDASAGLSDEQLSYLRMFTQGVTHVRQLLEDLLDLARLDAGAYPLALEPVDIRVAVSEAHLVIAPLLAERRQAFSLSTPANLPEVSADPLRLRQVLVNLLSNATKFSPVEGRIEIAVAFDGRSRRRVRVTVRDDGPGIPPELQARIFERFDRGSGSGPGTGLGLPLARDLVALHGGRLELTSHRGRGAWFTFTLNVAAASEPRAKPGAASEARLTAEGAAIFARRTP